jgi:hypothetical protein
MSSPMWDVPEHLLVPVTANGEGPAEGKEIAYYACWCGVKDCARWGA